MSQQQDSDSWGAMLAALRDNSTPAKHVINCRDAPPKQGLAEALSRNTSVKILQVSGSAYAVLEVAAALHVNTTIQKLGLMFTPIEQDGAVALAEALSRNRSLDAFLIRYAQDGSVLPVLTRRFNEYSITQLYLVAMHIDDDLVCELVEGLRQSATLVKLELARNRIGTEKGSHALADLLRHSRTITRFGIQDNNICGEPFAEAIRENTSLTDVDLMGNSISDLAVRDLAGVVRDCHWLKILGLSLQHATDDTVGEFCSALSQNTTLIALAVSSVRVESVCAFAKSVREHTSLYHLLLREQFFVRNTDISTDAARAFADLVAHNQSLRILEPQFQLGTDGAEALIVGLRRNSTLRHLELRASDVPEKVARVLEATLASTLTLSSIFFARAKLDEKVESKLRAAIAGVEFRREAACRAGRVLIFCWQQLQERFARGDAGLAPSPSSVGSPPVSSLSQGFHSLFGFFRKQLQGSSAFAESGRPSPPSSFLTGYGLHSTPKDILDEIVKLLLPQDVRVDGKKAVVLRQFDIGAL